MRKRSASAETYCDDTGFSEYEMGRSISKMAETVFEKAQLLKPSAA
ncbi:MAG: hypothetical protein R2941_01120 [Desulfobacterales bacterium]